MVAAMSATPPFRRSLFREGTKVLLALGVVAVVLWVALTFNRADTFRGVRVDSLQAFHEFVEGHNEAAALLESYAKSPPADLEEKREAIGRCATAIVNINPNLYRECDLGVKRAIRSYRKARREQFDLILAFLPHPPPENRASEAEARVQGFRRRAYGEMKRLRTELGLRKPD